MRKTQKKLLKRKLFIPIILLVFLFSIIKLGTALASTNPFTITSVEVSAKSSTVDVENLSFEGCKVTNNVTFYQVGDSITYKIKVKNNEDTSYTIKSLSDDNENKYVSYIYDNYEGTKLNSNEETTIEITEKYVQEIEEMSKRNQNFSVNIAFTLEDEQGNVINTILPVNTSSNPKTGDNVEMYLTTSIASLIMLILLSKKSKVRVSNNKIKTESRKIRARIMNSTIQANEFNDFSNMGRASRKNKGKHSGKGFKLFSLFIVGALILPTISKAATNYIQAITFENNITFKDKLIVSYKIGDEKYNITTKYNEVIHELVAPKNDGYDFAGWKLEDGTDFDPNTTKITDDTTIVPKFTPKSYTLTYNLNGGTLENENPTSFTIESNDIVLNKPTKEGYVFTGWTGTELTEKTMEVTIPKGSIGDREYTANFDANTYTIVFDAHTGSGTMANQTITYDVETNLSANEFTKTGYTFIGWNTKEDGQGELYRDKQAVKNLASEQGATIKLYAEWEANDYKVVFNKNKDGATGTMDNQSFKYDETKALTPNVFTKENYIFKNWNTRADGQGTVYTDGQSVSNLATSGDFNLYAQWADAYTVHFDANGGIGTMEDQTIEVGVPTQLNANSFEEIHNIRTFVKWNTAADGSGDDYTDGQSVTDLASVNESITLYAQWSQFSAMTGNGAYVGRLSIDERTGAKYLISDDGNMEIISETSNRQTSDFADDLSDRPNKWEHVKKLYTGTTLRTIGKNCFNGCTQLDGIDMDDVVYIKENAFANCTGLTRVCLPNYHRLQRPAIQLANNAFYGCINLKEVYYKETKYTSISQLEAALTADGVYFGENVFAGTGLSE